MVVLYRFHQSEHQTLGMLVVKTANLVTTLPTLELPWRDNENQVSCIPASNWYHAEPRSSEKFGQHFGVYQRNGEEVVGRTAVLIHAGNKVEHTHGCILVGSSFADIDQDGLTDVTGSRMALARLVELFPDGFDFEIRNI